MNVPKVFLDNWREGYKKMIDDAHEAIVVEMYKDLPPYVPDAHPSEKTLLRRFTRRFKSSGESWDAYWAKVDLDEAHSMHVVTDLSDKLVNMHPEFAAKHGGLRDLLVGLAMMQMTAGKCTDKWLMRVLKDFREIYRDNPGLCDYDALAAFVKLEELTEKPEQLRALDEVPRDIREGLDLGFDRNLKKYIDRYVMFIEDGGAPAPERDSAAISLTYSDYGDRVAKGEDGVYRWGYDRKAWGKPLPKKIFLRCFMLPALLFLILLVLPFAVLGPLLGLAAEMGAGAFVRTLFLVALTFTAVSLGIGALTYRLYYTRRITRYELREDGIRIMSVDEYRFSRIKFYEPLPQCDMIQLQRLAVPIYVPEEDFDMVWEFIKARLPEKAKRL